MRDYLRELIIRRQNGEKIGIPSYCTANPIVIEACLSLGKRINQPILIEATANQVNQFGGYTGMRPADFRDMVFGIADKIGFERNNLILGGDHLGPLTWAGLDEASAMRNAVDLVSEYVEAGFKKIHLDTSMKLASDAADKPLGNEVIASRGAILYEACMKAFEKRKSVDPTETMPSFIIGSEVPIPGGAQEAEDTLCVTKPEDFEKTLDAYEKAFSGIGIKNAFENVIGVVVQPGVEFGDDRVFRYDSCAAAELISCAGKHKNIVLEGHSTDYQTAESLKEMVRDGIAILKVGPALTFALREGLFALSLMERELIPAEKRAYFPEILERTMLADPSKWIKHYHGTWENKKMCRKYSYSDRCRYYLTNPDVENSIECLIENMRNVRIPLNMIHQYMPAQYGKIVRGHLNTDAYSLISDFVENAAEAYVYAVLPEYDITDVHY